MKREGEAPAEPSIGHHQTHHILIDLEMNRLELTMPDELPKRHHPAHGVLFVDGRSTIIFDTVCTKGRAKWLACDETHGQSRDVWRKATAWLFGRYVIMPDHIHLFAAATEPNIELDNWVRYWKSQFSKLHRNRNHRWQTDHWDTRMRKFEVYAEKWEYVRFNPVRHGLVEKPERCPYQGEIHAFQWD